MASSTSNSSDGQFELLRSAYPDLSDNEISNLLSVQNQLHTAASTKRTVKPRSLQRNREVNFGTFQTLMTVPILQTKKLCADVQCLGNEKPMVKSLPSNMVIPAPCVEDDGCSPPKVVKTVVSVVFEGVYSRHVKLSDQFVLSFLQQGGREEFVTKLPKLAPV